MDSYQILCDETQASNDPFKPGSVRCQEVDDNTSSASSIVESSENDPEDRYPRIIADPDRRHYVATSATPWIMANFDRRGYAFSDILYAATMSVDLNAADDIQRYPVIRSIRNPLRDLTVEIKALNHNGMIGNEKKDTANPARTLYHPRFRHIQRLAQDTIQCLKRHSRYPYRAQVRKYLYRWAVSKAGQMRGIHVPLSNLPRDSLLDNNQLEYTSLLVSLSAKSNVTVVAILC